MKFFKKILAVAISILSVSAFAHGGGVDERSCHAKNGVRHCHGENTGKYLPEKEVTRIKKLHDTTCNSLLPEGGYPKHDLYGKRCNKRN